MHQMTKHRINIGCAYAGMHCVVCSIHCNQAAVSGFGRIITRNRGAA